MSIIDILSKILFICMGVVIGFIFGLFIGVLGLIEFWNGVPNYLSIGFFIALSVGIFFMLFYIKKEKIEKRKDFIEEKKKK